MTGAAKIRPRAKYLVQLPTLAKMNPMQTMPPSPERGEHAGVDFLLELKLVTSAAHYCLCTRGLSRPREFTLKEGAGKVTTHLPEK
ncbi:MAG TPA: hypothetical protein VG013_21865 [Gemmataceae bacterium]|nr:hypothetical protein [Gemmataceae bacterium]